MDIGFKHFENRCIMLKKDYKLMEAKKVFGKGVMKCLNILALLLVM
ncbi:hypothetical protein [Clostridium perfringens]